MHQSALERLVRYLRENVPMARHFDIRAGQVDDRELVLEAPLASNFNDKQTAFAGTLASLCTLSGWAMTSLVCEEAGYQTDIAVIRSDVRYARPCTERIIRARCLWPAPEDAAPFVASLGERSRAVLSVENGCQDFTLRQGTSSTHHQGNLL